MNGMIEHSRIAVTALAVFMAACLAFCFALPLTAEAVSYQAGTVLAQSSSKAKSDTKKAAATKKAKVYRIRTAKQWKNISKYKGGTFKIMKNIRLTSTSQYLTISKNKKYTIDLNGHTAKTTYAKAKLRTASPLFIKKGSVVLKDSKKKKGSFYSTETAAITLSGKSKLYVKNVTIIDNATEFRSDIGAAIYATGSSKTYIQGNARISSISNGIALFGSSRLYVTANPYVRAGVNSYKTPFTHYGSAISIASRNARVSLKGGSYGTMSTPDAYSHSVVGSMRMTASGTYPILDQFGYAIGSAIPSGYKVVDKNGNALSTYKPGAFDYYNGITAPSMDDLLARYGYKSPRYYQVFSKGADGCYTVYVKKA